MSTPVTPADEHRRIAATFTDRVNATADWDAPARVEGWVARDVVDHLVEWLSAHFFTTWSVPVTDKIGHHEDPAAAWHWLDAGIRAGLADPSIAHVQFENGPLGLQSYEVAIDTICTPDILVHTWDLARAAGLDETLDPEEVRRYLENVAGFEEEMVKSGHYGPQVDVPRTRAVKRPATSRWRAASSVGSVIRRARRRRPGRRAWRSRR